MSNSSQTNTLNSVRLTEDFEASIPRKRFGTPDEIAKPVVFLVSDDSSYITGIELFFDDEAAQI